MTSRGGKLAGTLASVPGMATSLVSTGGLIMLALGIALFTLFVVHQLSIWISLDPETAFHRAKQLISGYATVYNTVGNVWNGFVEVSLIGIPAWNAGVEYVVQPLVFTTLDILSIAFTQRPYTGVLTEDAIPYEGFVCPLDGSLDKSSEWCGQSTFYAQQLGQNNSNFKINSKVVLSTETARRLSELTGDPIVGVLDLSFLIDALYNLVGSVIFVTAELSDVIFHVAWTVLSEAFDVILNLFLVLIRATTSLVMMLVRSGLLRVIIDIGVNLITILIVDVFLPLMLSVLQMVLCIVDYTQVAGWNTQLDCVERTCFQEGSDVFGEVFHTFSSVAPISKVLQRVVMRLINPSTGQSYSSSSEGQMDIPEVDAGSTETPRTQACAACFNCKVMLCLWVFVCLFSYKCTFCSVSLTFFCVVQIPEMRAIFILIGTIYGCAIDGEKYAGHVENYCLMGGMGYVELCGPRNDISTQTMSDYTWRKKYTLHQRFNAKTLQSYASRFEKLSIELGGQGNDGFDAHNLASKWLNRDVGLGAEQSAAFVRGVCTKMRLLTSVDGGPDHSMYPKGEMLELTMGLMYEQCKYAKGIETCQVDVGQQVIDYAFEISSCMKSQPQCKRQRQICVGKCNGDGGGVLAQDFATTISKQELSVASLGSEALNRGRANCSIETRVIEVPLFATGESFELYASRLRVRGGFTAIDVRACKREPLACAAVQRVLEKEPTLTYDTTTGRFRHAYSLSPPNPPPPPMPPPRLIQYTTKLPPPAPPPPASPPPWFESLEQCVVRLARTPANVTLILLEFIIVLCAHLLFVCCFTSQSSPPPKPTSTPPKLKLTRRGRCVCTYERFQTNGLKHLAAFRKCRLSHLHPHLCQDL
jgi:hypothetical protein